MESEKNRGDVPEHRSSKNRGALILRSFLKPLNVLTLIAGLGVYFTTGAFLFFPLTLAVYAALVALSFRDPVFREKVEGGGSPSKVSLPPRDISPERRARWLARGETREKVEAALVTYRKAILAIEESDDVTLRVLEGAIPKLDEAANRLVDVAANRERAVKTLEDFKDDPADKTATEPSDPNSHRKRSLDALRDHVQRADSEINDISSRFMTLRAQAVRATMDSAGAKQQAEAINSSLDDLNYRLEALDETFSNRDETR